MEKVVKMNAAEATETYSKIFGANKNYDRAIPAFQDGLKPGKRRLFYSFWEYCGKPQDIKPSTLKNLKFHKVQTIASNAMIYHPHGDVSNADIIGNEGRYWTTNVRTIDPQGNYGSIRGDVQAASRYIECRMSQYLIDCFFEDFDKYCVPMKESYDGERMEPEYLPTKYPHVLFNHQVASLGFAAVSNIAPFNVTEVLSATISLIRNPDADILLIPDIPSKCDIIDTGDFKEMNKTGVGKVVMRASYKIDYKKNIITFTSLPMMISSKNVIKAINNMMANDGKFKEILFIDDYTKLGEVKINIHLKQSVNPDDVLKDLFTSRLDLKKTIPFSLTLVDELKMRTFGIKEYLLEWIEYRRDLIRSMLLNNQIQVMEKQHMNDVLLFVFNKDNAEETLKICKASSSRKDTIEKLMKKYKITSLQAATIADMRLYHFNKDTYQRYKDEKVELKNELDRIMRTINDERLIDELIISQLEEGIKRYGHERHSKVIKDKKKTTIVETEHIIAISTDGYIKKIRIDNNTDLSSIIIGDVGDVKDNYRVLRLWNTEDVFILTSKGTATIIPIAGIPDTGADGKGIPIDRYFGCSGNIVGVLRLSSKKMLKSEGVNIIFTTKMGYCKEVHLNDFKIKSVTAPKSQNIQLKETDELISALFVMQDCKDNVLIYTDKGRGIRIDHRDIPCIKYSSTGSKIVELDEDENILSAILINKEHDKIFYVTALGKAKLTETKYLPTMKRKDQLLQIIPITGRDKLLFVKGINSKRDKEFEVFFKNSPMIELPFSDVPVTTKIAKAEKVISIPKGDVILNVKIKRS